MDAGALAEAYRQRRKDIEAEAGFSLEPETFVKHYEDVVDEFLEFNKSQRETTVLGIQGPVGVGKTTLSITLKHVFRELGFTVDACSTDDFYHRYEVRKQIAQKYKNNPLYQISRGMPGTHDVERLCKTLECAKTGKPFTIPAFDKSLHGGEGDPVGNGREVSEKLDMLIIEGWCLMMPHGKGDVMVTSTGREGHVLKVLESLNIKEKDLDDVFDNVRQYERVWKLVDHVVYLLPEDVRHIEDWRVEQEQLLIKQKGSGKSLEEARKFAQYFIPFSYYISDHARGSHGRKVNVKKDRSVY